MAVGQRTPSLAELRKNSCNIFGVHRGDLRSGPRAPSLSWDLKRRRSPNSQVIKLQVAMQPEPLMMAPSAGNLT
ncbi:hypothetical protein CR201_G0046830 [Pongo abelii]|uniref:Uncharacterized protein n=1 Tax=Pongo abelii TaxID=9601 RepID=A0A2J8S2Q1_PONAB|nr:hypothetical protein CR201_G0046830 [Pongo abelii]